MANILVVDDEDNVRFVIRETLEQDYHEVSEARTGNEALKMFEQKPVELVITDLVMPDKNGIDLILALKNRSPNVRIVAISGGGGLGGRFDYIPIAELIGARSVMRKPFNVFELRDVVNELLTVA
jgi:YesN/AraC family two-component response regulator